jgi:hypothetical protein
VFLHCLVSLYDLQKRMKVVIYFVGLVGVIPLNDCDVFRLQLNGSRELRSMFCCEEGEIFPYKNIITFYCYNYYKQMDNKNSIRTESRAGCL